MCHIIAIGTNIIASNHRVVYKLNLPFHACFCQSYLIRLDLQGSTNISIQLNDIKTPHLFKSICKVNSQSKYPNSRQIIIKMPYNKLPRLREPHGQHVQEVRDKFLELHYKQEPELYYSDDIKQVENMEFLLQRCLIVKRKDVQESLEMLVNVLKWRKQRKLRELSLDSFPKEYYMCGAAFLYENDKFDNRTLYIRTGMLRNIPDLKNSFKDYICYLMYLVDDSCNGHSWSVIFDLTNTGWNNYDLDLLMHFLNLLREYFPVNLDYVLAINFPWVLTAAWTVAKRLIPPERRDVVMFISDKEIFSYVDKENCPSCLGGTCERDPLIPPKGCPSTVSYMLQMEDKIPSKRIKEAIKAMSDMLPKDHVAKMYKELEESGRK